MSKTRSLYFLPDRDQPWRWGDPANCNDHKRVYIKRDHDYHFSWGSNREHKLFWRDMIGYCKDCDHICYDTQSARDNDSPSRIGEWVIQDGDAKKGEKDLRSALACMELEERVMELLEKGEKKRKEGK